MIAFFWRLRHAGSRFGPGNGLAAQGQGLASCVRSLRYRAPLTEREYALDSWPTLANPPFGGRLLSCSNKEKDLHDPWGMLYLQAFEVDDRGFVWHRIWTEREVNGTVKRIGYPPKGKR